MAKFRVTLYREIPFSQTVEVEADDEEGAEAAAWEKLDDDTNTIIETWTAGDVRSGAEADIEEL